MTGGVSVTETVKASERYASTPSDEWAPIPDWDERSGWEPPSEPVEPRSLPLGASCGH
jgi:hypothetical protein